MADKPASPIESSQDPAAVFEREFGKGKRDKKGRFKKQSKGAAEAAPEPIQRSPGRFLVG